MELMTDFMTFLLWINLMVVIQIRYYLEMAEKVAYFLIGISSVFLVMTECNKLAFYIILVINLVALVLAFYDLSGKERKGN